MKTAVEILSELTGIPIYRLQCDDEGEFITKRGALQAMEEYAAQYRESGKPEPVEQGKQWLLRWLIEERNLLSNSASLMWNDPLQEKTKQVAECLRVTIEYIEKSFEEATKKQHG